MPKWEYKSLKYKRIEVNKLVGVSQEEEEYIYELNKLGEDRWELVDILHYTYQGTLSAVHFILKRQVNE